MKIIEGLLSPLFFILAIIIIVIGWFIIQIVFIGVAQLFIYISENTNKIVAAVIVVGIIAYLISLIPSHNSSYRQSDYSYNNNYQSSVSDRSSNYPTNNYSYANSPVESEISSNVDTYGNYNSASLSPSYQPYTTENNVSYPIDSVAVSDAYTNEAISENEMINSQSLLFIKKYINRYPSTIGLFDNDVFQRRITNLTGWSNFYIIKQNRSFESLITQIGDRLFIWGCNKYNLKNETEIYLDLKTDILSIKMRNGDSTYYFSDASR